MSLRSLSPLPRAVCFLLRDPTGAILAVSRPGTSDRFGLPGGKVDPGETDEEAVIREVLEETGLMISAPREVFRAVCEGEVSYDTGTYEAFVGPRVAPKEKLTVAFVTPQQLVDGPFGTYNRALFHSLGVDYKLDLARREALVEKLRLLEAAYSVAVDHLDRGDALDGVLSDLEEVSHALSVYVTEMQIIVDGPEDSVEGE